MPDLKRVLDRGAVARPKACPGRPRAQKLAFAELDSSSWQTAESVTWEVLREASLPGTGTGPSPGFTNRLVDSQPASWTSNPPRGLTNRLVGSQNALWTPNPPRGLTTRLVD
eukprot:364377-Chlamydomonas_euryale.AAC.1